jgi:hypothetical protein
MLVLGIISYVAVDTTQATDSNRGKLYINGEQQTLFQLLHIQHKINLL